MRTENPLQQSVEKNTRDLVMMDSLSDIRRDLKIENFLNSNCIRKSIEDAFEKYNIAVSLIGIKDINGADVESKGKGLFYIIHSGRTPIKGGMLSKRALFGAVVFNNNSGDLYLYFEKQKENGEFGCVSSDVIRFPYEDAIVPKVGKLFYSKEQDFKTEKDIKGSNCG